MLSRRSFLKRTMGFLAVAVGVPAALIPKTIEAAPVAFTDCYSAVPGTSTPVFDFGPEDIKFSFRELAEEIGRDILESIIGSRGQC